MTALFHRPGGPPPSAFRRAGVRLATGLVSIAVLIVLVECLLVAFRVPEFLLPTPSSVFASFRASAPMLGAGALVTLRSILITFAISIVLGITLAIVTTEFSFGRSLFEPGLVILQMVPKVAVAPLMLVWLGLGLPAVVTTAVLISFFAMYSSAVVGLRSFPGDIALQARLIGLSKAHTIAQLKLRFAAPYMAAGARSCVVLCSVGVIVGEFLVSDKGLGYFVLETSARQRTSTAFAGIAGICFIGILCYALVELGAIILLRMARATYHEVGEEQA